MIVLSILGSLAVIGVLCWLLFTLAVFALPFFLGLAAGTWAHGTGAGWLGAATHGIVKHIMPSETWQFVFSGVGAIAVGIVAFVRLTALIPSEPPGRGITRA
ncbi:hypothetical protein [Xanthobacter autotrophicus]|uniref:hypothetical protein n=1 Tax=Xanthobacter autotrophicus TaxID=280 RepID=UPI0037288FBA